MMRIGLSNGKSNFSLDVPYKKQNKHNSAIIPKLIGPTYLVLRNELRILDFGDHF